MDPRAQRAGTHLAVVMLDVDNFKLLNDHYGHLADAALYRAKAAGRNCLRSPAD